jgi:hypothetical protein
MLDLSLYLSASAIAALPLNMTTKEAADWKFLKAVALVESGDRYNTIGDGGRALGKYQMHIGSWVDGNGWLKAHGRKTWTRSSWLNPKAQDQVAYGFLQVTKERLVNGGHEADTITIYLVYAMGYQGWKDAKGMIPKEKADAAVRVGNLFAQ